MSRIAEWYQFSTKRFQRELLVVVHLRSMVKTYPFRDSGHLENARQDVLPLGSYAGLVPWLSHNIGSKHNPSKP
jgi:hypothetical protein